MKTISSRMRTQTEHQIQSAFFALVRLNPLLKTIPIFAIPNGGKRSSAIEGANLKREGVTAGVADVFAGIVTDRAAGLFIEFKRPGEKQSPAQVAFQRRIEDAGYVYVVMDDAVKAYEYVYNMVKVKRMFEK